MLFTLFGSLLLFGIAGGDETTLSLLPTTANYTNQLVDDKMIMENEKLGEELRERFDNALMGTNTDNKLKITAIIEMAQMAASKNIKNKILRKKRHTLPGDPIRECCKQKIPHSPATYTVRETLTCAQSEASAYTYGCGSRWFRRRRCTGYRLSYKQSTCYTQRAMYYQVHNECPKEQLACCIGNVYLPKKRYAISPTIFINVPETCLDIPLLRKVLDSLDGLSSGNQG